MFVCLSVNICDIPAALPPCAATFQDRRAQSRLGEHSQVTHKAEGCSPSVLLRSCLPKVLWTCAQGNPLPFGRPAAAQRASEHDLLRLRNSQIAASQESCPDSTHTTERERHPKLDGWYEQEFTMSEQDDWELTQGDEHDYMLRRMRVKEEKKRAATIKMFSYAEKRFGTPKNVFCGQMAKFCL